MAQWYVVRDGKEHGPITPEKLKELAVTGRLQPTDPVRRDDMPAPRAAGEVKGLFPASEKPAGRSTPPPLPPSVRLAASAVAPAGEVGTVVIVRRPKLTGFLNPVRISADGVPHGSIGGGLPDGLFDLLGSKERSLALILTPGDHELELAGGGLTRKEAVRVEPDRVRRFTVFFSNMGAVGGGIKFVEAGTTEGAAAHPAPATLAGERSVTSKGTAKVGVLAAGVFVLMFLCCGGLAWIGGGGGGGSGAGDGLMERETFREAVISRSADEVHRAVGRPDSTSGPGDYELWSYEGRTFDPVTGKSDLTANVFFKNGRADSVSFY